MTPSSADHARSVGRIIAIDTGIDDDGSPAGSPASSIIALTPPSRPSYLGRAMVIQRHGKEVTGMHLFGNAIQLDMSIDASCRFTGITA